MVANLVSCHPDMQGIRRTPTLLARLLDDELDLAIESSPAGGSVGPLLGADRRRPCALPLVGVRRSRLQSPPPCVPAPIAKFGEWSGQFGVLGHLYAFRRTVYFVSVRSRVGQEIVKGWATLNAGSGLQPHRRMSVLRGIWMSRAPMKHNGAHPMKTGLLSDETPMMSPARSSKPRAGARPVSRPEVAISGHDACGGLRITTVDPLAARVRCGVTS